MLTLSWHHHDSFIHSVPRHSILSHVDKVQMQRAAALLLERNGRASSGKRTHHIDIRYFFITDRVKRGELRIEYCPTDEMLGDFFTKPQQGSLFRRMRARLMNSPANTHLSVTTPRPQECVGNASPASWADVVQSTDGIKMGRPQPPNSMKANRQFHRGNGGVLNKTLCEHPFGTPKCSRHKHCFPNPSQYDGNHIGYCSARVKHRRSVRTQR